MTPSVATRPGSPVEVSGPFPRAIVCDLAELVGQSRTFHTI